MVGPSFTNVTFGSPPAARALRTGDRPCVLLLDGLGGASWLCSATRDQWHEGPPEPAWNCFTISQKTVRRGVAQQVPTRLRKVPPRCRTPDGRHDRR